MRQCWATVGATRDRGRRWTRPGASSGAIIQLHDNGNAPKARREELVVFGNVPSLTSRVPFPREMLSLDPADGRVGLLGGFAASCAAYPHDEIDVAVQDMQEGQQLVERLPVVGLVQETVELRRGCSQPPDDLPFREGAGLDPLLGFEGELVQQRIPQVGGILVVFQDLLEVHRSLSPRGQHIGKPLPVQFLVHKGPRETIPGGQRGIHLGVGKHPPPCRGLDLKRLLAVVAGDRSDFQSRPSVSSSAMSSTTLRGAPPFIAFWFSGSHFTMNFAAQ